MALIVMSAYFSQQPKMILLVVIIVHAGIVFSGFAIYKNWTISAIETTLHINIIITSLAVYFWNPDTSYCIPSFLGTGVGLVCLFVTLFHNILNPSLVWIKSKKKIVQNDVVNSEVNPIDCNENIPHMYRNDEYRELLLNSD